MAAEDRGDILTVGELTFAIKGLLQDHFPHVVVRGQISNLRRQSSGHLYFTLKDDEASVSCALWRMTATRLRFRPEDGQEVVAEGRVEVYAPHGKYQLIVAALQPLGLGELHLRYEALKKKLAQEGMFDPSRKKRLPMLSRRVAVVTSPTSAAVRDLLRIAYRRMPRAWVTVFPVRVQGPEAVPEIVAALEQVSAVGEFDAVILARGGGSIEDLWCFNEEAVARAIAACDVPVVSAVGHETDTTIADHVADQRAATPSEAAELVFPDAADLLSRLVEGRGRVDRAATRLFDDLRGHLESLAKTHALARPVERFRLLAQQLDDWEERALAALSRRVDRAGDRMRAVAGHLEAVSPLSVLARGYSITTVGGARAPLTDASAVEPGQELVTRLHAGRVHSRVEFVEPPQEESP